MPHGTLLHGPRLCSAPLKERCAASGARDRSLATPFFINLILRRRHTSASSRLASPELCFISTPSSVRGRREDRVPAGTRGPLCESCATKLAQRHTGEAKQPAFPAQWFDGLCRALPGERCTIAPVALRMADPYVRSGRTHHHKTWRADPGRQDDTVLPYADRSGRVRDAIAHGYPPCDAYRADAVQRPPRLIPRS